jgi:hypothetical protein
LAIYKSVKGLDVGGVLLNALLVGLDGHQLIVLGLKALSLNESTAALHLLVAIAVVKLHFQRGQTLVVLLVQQQRPGC